MHQGCTGRSSWRKASAGKIEAKEAVLMGRLIARLIRCGMTREVALCVSRQYRGRPRDFELYVESVEAEQHEQMEEL
jgi:hypothetical protein